MEKKSAKMDPEMTEVMEFINQHITHHSCALCVWEDKQKHEHDEDGAGDINTANWNCLKWKIQSKMKNCIELTADYTWQKNISIN